MLTKTRLLCWWKNKKTKKKNLKKTKLNCRPEPLHGFVEVVRRPFSGKPLSSLSQRKKLKKKTRGRKRCLQLPRIRGEFSQSSAKKWEVFVLRKKGSKTKERMNEEEIEKGDCGRQPEVFFWDFVELEPSEDGPVACPANAFDSHLRGD